MKAQNIVFQVTRFAAAIIMLQTLFYKFSASAESVYIFSTLGMEPWGRIGIGIAELIAAALLMVSRWSWAGALLSMGLMAGAVGMHLTLLGVEVMGDKGYLFALAMLVLSCSAVVFFLQKARALQCLQELRSRVNA